LVRDGYDVLDLEMRKGFVGVWICKNYWDVKEYGICINISFGEW